jgi:MoxR-like ATPase
MFNDISQVTKALGQQQYISTDEISTVMFLAEKLEKPILTEGPAGVGKTELAKAWSRVTCRPLIRLQCYEGLDESKALYEWEYAKQMLYTQLLRDKLSEVLSNTQSLTEAADRLGKEDNVFFSDRFLLPRPLLQAITSPEPVVLLIDEIDRADAEFEAFLLEILSDFQVSVPELGTIAARHMPIVILTSNNTRELSEALKRRCLYLFIDYPSQESEMNIVRMRVPGLSQKLAQQAVEVVQNLRQMDLKKSPSVSETIDWAKALVMLNADGLDKRTLENTLTVLLKHESDVQKARRALLGGKEHPLQRRGGSDPLSGGGRRGGGDWPN